jgi:hypothetical protein
VTKLPRSITGLAARADKGGILHFDDGAAVAGAAAVGVPPVSGLSLLVLVALM